MAVAPAFLLSALGLLINLFATRLARVVDRARWLEEQFATLPRSLSVPELRLLDRRMRIINTAIALATASAIAVCLLVVMLFVAGLLDTRFGRTVASLFIVAMLLLIAALGAFLYEVRLASRAIRIRNELLERE
nr:DUF2721 domain-containing protein [Sphingomonas chungangi]